MKKLELSKQIKFSHAGAGLLVIILLMGFCEVVNLPLIIPLLLLFTGIHLFLFRKASTRLFLNLGLLLSLMLASTVTMIQYTTIEPLYLPFVSIAMLVMLLFNDLEVTFISSFVTSILAGLLIADHPVGRLIKISRIDLTIIVFIGSLTAAYTVYDARTRGKLLGAGVYAGIMQVICMVLLHHDMEKIFTRDYLIQFIQPLFLSGIISTFVVIATLKIFEYLFGVLTNFSLMELSDFNQPLLKRMIMEAPGTYHHSLVVSNISEAAADSIGANALLTRVGAYYHDIGKMVKPEYYTENQLVGGNIHDRIEPSISRLVIINHVKEGIDLARKYKLNQKIVDFIPEHHGTSLMYFFYQKALEEAENESSVNEENFRYPGPKPQSKETAIVLLADSVEAATRTIDEPNPTKIEEVVRKIINNKFIDGQLDECSLTLKEIETIATTFTRVLSAMYHARVKYPEKKNGSDNRNQKSAEKISNQPRKDPQNRKEDS